MAKNNTAQKNFDSSLSNQLTYYSSWYTISFIATLAIPTFAAITAASLTLQPAYLLSILAAAYFAIRNHRLYHALI